METEVKNIVRFDFKALKYLIFDLDGTLIDSKSDIAKAMNEALSSLGFRTLKEEVFSFIGWGLDNSIRNCLPLDKRDLNTKEELKDAFHLYYGKRCLDETKLLGGVKDFLERASDVGHIIVTNKDEKYTKMILNGLGVDHYFSLIISGDTLDVKKPNPKAVHMIQEKYSVKNTELLMIGDGLPDIEIAKATNVKSVALEEAAITDFNLVLEAKPDYVFAKFSDFSEFYFRAIDKL